MCRRSDENEKQDVCHVDFAQIGFRPKVLGTYRKVVSSNTSHLEAHAGFFRLLMKGIFDPLVL